MGIFLALMACSSWLYYCCPLCLHLDEITITWPWQYLKLTYSIHVLCTGWCIN